MRDLPKHIYPNSGAGYVIRLKRAQVQIVACIPFGGDQAAALVRAVAKRDALLAEHGPAGIAPARSNTGITGICEVTKWFHSKPYDCFQVTTASPKKTGSMKRFFYRGESDREVALRRAIAHRARVLGVSEAEVLKEAA